MEPIPKRVIDLARSIAGRMSIVFGKTKSAFPKVIETLCGGLVSFVIVTNFNIGYGGLALI